MTFDPITLFMTEYNHQRGNSQCQYPSVQKMKDLGGDAVDLRGTLLQPLLQVSDLIYSPHLAKVQSDLIESRKVVWGVVRAPRHLQHEEKDNECT